GAALGSWLQPSASHECVGNACSRTWPWKCLNLWSWRDGLRAVRLIILKSSSEEKNGTAQRPSLPSTQAPSILSTGTLDLSISVTPSAYAQMRLPIITQR